MEAASPQSGPGHNAWQMTSAALVLFMTLPGLALFYGGLVRRKNVLSVMAQCMLIAGLVTILWYLCGYSLVFHKGSALLGESGLFLPQWSRFQPQRRLLLLGLAERVLHVSINVRHHHSGLDRRGHCRTHEILGHFSVHDLWMFVVYFPQAHMIWEIDGMMNGLWNANAKIKAIDFAGGTVVHMTSGWSAPILCIILGRRTGFGKENFAPHSMVLCMIGTGMLWVGWYDFNAGSARGGGRDCRQRFHHYLPGHGRCLLCLADDRVGCSRQARVCSVFVPVRCPGHHPGLRIRHAQRRHDYRHFCRGDSLVLLLQSQELVWL